MVRGRTGYFPSVLGRPAHPLRLVQREPSPGTAPPGDEQILAAFATGDRRAAGLVYDRLIGVVDATLYRVVGTRGDDHDDLVQAAFEQIILTLTKNRFARGCSLRGWAASIAGHVGLNAIRSRTRARRVFDAAADVDRLVASRRSPDDVEAQVAARRDLDRVRRYLAELDPDRATTVLVHDVFGHSLAETAQLTGVSMTAAQSRLSRGRRDLAERLSREDAE